MKYLKLIFASLAFAAVTANNCGAGIGKCSKGLCCSKYGYCGETTEYSGTGCESEFGRCDDVNTKAVTTKKTTTTTKQKKVTTTTKAKKSTTSTKKTSTKKTTTKKTTTKKTTTKKVVTTKNGTTTVKKVTTTKKTTTTTISKKISSDGKCGTKYGTTCPDGYCCSQYGYCGRTTEYCGKGCQSEFGKCDTTSNVTKKTTTTKKSTTTTVIKTNPNKVPFKFFYECKNKNDWALTFDDGPYKFDHDLLDLLKKYNIKATFFLNGDNVLDITSKKGEEIVKRMYKEGHVIGNHTWKHVDLEEASESEIIEQMTKVEDVLMKYIGKKPAFMRLPYGSGTGDDLVKKTLDKLGYTAGFQWNVDTMDWDNKGDVDYALSKFKAKLGKGILSLNHCYYSGMTSNSLVNLIEKEIQYMKKQGYRNVTAAECVGLPAYQ